MRPDELFMKLIEVSIIADGRSFYPEKARDIICTAHNLVPFIHESPEELTDKAGEFYDWMTKGGEVPGWVVFKVR